MGAVTTPLGLDLLKSNTQGSRVRGNPGLEAAAPLGQMQFATQQATWFESDPERLYLTEGETYSGSEAGFRRCER